MTLFAKADKINISNRVNVYLCYSRGDIDFDVASFVFLKIKFGGEDYF